MSPALTLLGTFGYCIASGFVPLIGAEAYVLIVAAVAPPELRLGIAVAAASGQMIAKSGMYAIGRGLFSIPHPRIRGWVERAEAWARARPKTEDAVVFVSAVTGFPPFYLVSIAGGMVRFNFTTFFVLGLVGRFLRFGAVVMLPQLARAIWGSPT